MRARIGWVVAAALGAAALTTAPTVAAATPPGLATLYNTRVAASVDTSVFIMGNNLNNIASLTFTCNDSGATTVVVDSVTPVAGTNNGLASFTVSGSSLAGIPTPATCSLTTVTPDSGPPFSRGGLSLSIRGNAVVVDSPTPSQVGASFPASQAPTVRVPAGRGTSLRNVTGVTQVMCSINPVGQYPIPASATQILSTQVGFVPQSLPAGTCGILLTYSDGSNVLVPAAGSQGFAQALTYTPWVTGPIRIQLTNTTDIDDADLYVGLMASGGGSVSGFTGFNASTMTSVAFTDLVNAAGTSTYTPASSGAPTGGTAYIEVQQPVSSGTLYFSDQDFNGDNPPDPRISTARYAMAEFTYDQGFFSDLTLIDQIGLAMSSELYSDAAGTQALPDTDRTTGCLATLVSALQDVVPTGSWTAGNPDGTGGIIRYNGSAIVGYTGAAKKPSAYMTTQVQSYVAHVQTLSPLQIHDVHNATNQAGPFDYTATYDSSTDLWTLTGTITDGAKVPGPTLYVESASIYAQGSNGGTGYAMYGEDGPFKVVLANGTNYGWGNGIQVSGTGYQDLVKTIYRDFIAAFAYGYWGSQYGPGPGTDTGPLASAFTLDPVTSAYANAGVPAQYAAWNSYDQVIRLNTTGGGGASGAYGTAYSDTFLPDGLSPAIGTYSAQNWSITLGDPPGCQGPAPTPTPVPTPTATPTATPTPTPTPTPAAALSPNPQSIIGIVGRPVASAVMQASGFTGTVTYSLSDAAPAGMSFNTATGVLSGTPTAEVDQTFTITGTGSGSGMATASLTLTIGEPA